MKMATSRPAPTQLSHQPLTTRLRPTPLTALVTAGLVLLKRRSRRRLPLAEPVKWALVVLAAANWRSVPFWWSARLGLVIQSAWLRYFILGKKVLEPIVGKDPFGATSVTKHVASFNACAPPPPYSPALR